jgi:hypothetical protein
LTFSLAADAAWRLSQTLVPQGAPTADRVLAYAAASAMKRRAILLFFHPGTSWRSNVLFLF